MIPILRIFFDMPPCTVGDEFPEEFPPLSKKRNFLLFQGDMHCPEQHATLCDHGDTVFTP
jgi:hypothetical protein